ncbi:hypothetical protein D9M73_174060 [compost metagenome]
MTWRWPKASYRASSTSLALSPKRAAALRSMLMWVMLPPSCKSLEISRKAGLARNFSVRRWVQVLRVGPSLLLSTYWYWARLGPELRLMSWPARRYRTMPGTFISCGRIRSMN